MSTLNVNPYYRVVSPTHRKTMEVIFTPAHLFLGCFMMFSNCFSVKNSLFGHWTIFPPSANMGNLYQEPKFTLRKRFPCSIHPRREKHVPWKGDPPFKRTKTSSNHQFSGAFQGVFFGRISSINSMLDFRECIFLITSFAIHVGEPSKV